MLRCAPEKHRACHAERQRSVPVVVRIHDRCFAALLRNIVLVTLSASEASRWLCGFMPRPLAALGVTGEDVSPGTTGRRAIWYSA